MSINPPAISRPTLWPIAWKTTLYRLGWLLFGLCLALVLLLLILGQRAAGFLPTDRVVEFVVPLFAGLQAAYAFSAEDERPLELILAAPRPIRWLLLERVGILLALYLAIGLAGMALLLALNPDLTLTDRLVRWLPPLIWFTGLGFYLTLLSRQGAFGALVVWLIWGASLAGSGGLPQQLWWAATLLPYLQPELPAVSPQLYTLNRLTVVAGGLLLLVLALRLLGNEARLLDIQE